MIRTAIHDDVEAIVRIGCRFAREQRENQSLPVRPEAVAALVAETLVSPDRVVYVLETDGEIEGVIGGMLFVHPFAGERTAVELFWWVLPESAAAGIKSRGLIRALEAWARERGATLVQLMAPRGTKAARLYARLGYDADETSYTRRM